MYRADRWVTLKDITPIPSDYEEERSLNWAAGTLDVLRYAFELGLDRYTGWQCPNKPRFIDAGRVYKRGVAVNRVAELPSSLITHRICMVEDPIDLLPYLGKDRFTVADKNALGIFGYFIHSGIMEQQEITVGLEWPGEDHKDLSVVAGMLDKWRKFGDQRMKWTVIGGGALIDVCAFAASCIGAKIDLLPTTLLAMVDAAIGGKNGVNSEFGKNQIGSYYFPDNVIVCSYWLLTLPKEEIYAGSWECIKMGLLAGDLQLVDQWLSKICADPDESWVKLIKSTAAIKGRLIDLDPFEIYDLRQLLNLGHTLGHALETVALSNDSNELRHGEAVGVGLIYALLLSKKLGKLSTADDLLSKLASHPGLLSKRQLAKKIRVNNLNNPKLWLRLRSAIVHDKKRRADKVPWVILRDQQNDEGYYAELTVIDDQYLLLACWQQLLAFLSQC